MKTPYNVDQTRLEPVECFVDTINGKMWWWIRSELRWVRMVELPSDQDGPETPPVIDKSHK